MSILRDTLIEARTALDTAINNLTAVEAEVEEQDALQGAQPVARKLCWGAKVSKDFRDSVYWIEQQLHLDADHLMACMAFETGVTFSPKVKNAHSSATGLIQFMDATARQLGTTTAALAAMSAVRQLGYVYKYFAHFGKDLSQWDLADTYMAILLPSMIGKPLDMKMSWNEQAYLVNRGLDLNHDGHITKAEACKRVTDLFKMGNLPENAA